MKSTKRLLCLLLSAVMVLNLFAGCSKAPAETEPTVSGGLALIDESALAHLEKTSVAHVKAWLQMLFPDAEIQTGDPDNGNAISIDILSSAIKVTVNLSEEAPEHFTSLYIDLYQNNEETFLIYKALCASAVECYYDGLTADDAALLFDIEPVADENFVYEGDAPIQTTYFADGNRFRAEYYHNTGYLWLSTWMDDGTLYFTIDPPVPCRDPFVQGLEGIINDALTQAGHPVSLAFMGNPYPDAAFTYTGSGEDIYTENLGLYLETSDNQLVYFYSNAFVESPEETSDAARTIFTAVAELFLSDPTEEYWNAFFELKNHARSEFVVCNDFGTMVEQDSEGGFRTTQQLEGMRLDYSEYADGGNFCSINTDGGSLIQSSGTNTLLLDNFLTQLYTKYPDTYEEWRNFDRCDLRIPYDDNPENDYLLSITPRYRDQAILEIGFQEDNVADPAREQWLREVSADIAVICCNNLTQEDASGLFDIDPGFTDLIDAMIAGYYYNDFLYDYFEEGIYIKADDENSDFYFTILMVPEDAPPAENMFAEMNLWNGPSVVNGQFEWLQYYFSGTDIMHAFNDGYFADIGSSLSMEWKDFNFVEVEGVGLCDFTRFSLENLETIPGMEDAEYLDPDSYRMVTIADEIPHFILFYNEDFSSLIGMEEGYHFQGATPEDMRQMAICLSLLCDDDMTVAEATELFSHSMEPTKTYSNATVTYYCPGDVVHILAYFPDTGACEYEVMTKVDFDYTYGSIEKYLD